MSKKRFFVPLAAFSLLLTSLVACNSGNNSKEENTSKETPTTSVAPAPSSNAGGVSSVTPAPSSVTPAPSSVSPASSSEAPVHVHDYKDAATKVVKNADDKDVSLFECKDNDGGKLIAIKFADCSEKKDDFDSAANASKYGEVAADLWADAVMLKKSSDTTVTWKVNVDKAITGAKLSFGINSTYASHGNTDVSGKFQIKVNDGAFANWEAIGTYSSIGLAPTKRTYVVFKTIDLVAGENVITLKQADQENRLLFGGDVKIEYEGEALPVAAPATGYNVTFVPGEHCKVKVYLGANELEETNKTQTVNADATDEETQRYIPAKYAPAVEDDPATDVDESVKEVKPGVMFQLVFDDGYTADGNDITISGTMGNQWNKLCSFDDPDSYEITKIKADITVTIDVRAVTGEEPEGYVGTFSVEHGTLIVYEGAKNKAGDNIETAVGGKYFSRIKDTGVASKTKAQFNFEVIPEEGYEFVSGLDLGGESSPTGVTAFCTGHFGNFKRDKKVATLYSITKVASDITLNIVCTPVAGE